MDLLELRKKGVLPSIDIAGQDFTVDIRLNELRNREEPWRKLRLDEMVTSPDGRHYIFFYDPGEKAILHVDQELQQVPERAVLVEIPDEMGLDPVGVARKYGLSDGYFLKMHPLEKSMVARITALEKSGLHEYLDNDRIEGREVKRGLGKI